MPPKSPKGASLTIYIDCVSPYSWFGFTSILKHRPALQANGVTIDIQPFFLGGAREAAGNPWQPTPKWREAFGQQDVELTGELLGIKTVQPEIFPTGSLFPVRVATYIKRNYPSSTFESVFLALVSGYWAQGIDISKAAGILKALSPLFSTSEIEDIVKKALEPENKKAVIETTKESGAFGAPWIIGIDSEGKKRSWFGNDRWDQVFYHMGVPFEGVRVLVPKESKL